MITLFFIFTSCEKDLYEDALSQNKKDFKFKTIRFDELKKQHPKTVKAIAEIQPSLNSNTQARVKDLYGFIVDTTNIIYLEKEDGFKSYTFKIGQEKGLNYFKNIIVSNYPDGSQEIVMVKFNLNKSLEKVKLEKSFKQSLTSSEVSKYSNTNRTFDSYSCIEVGYYTTVDKCEGELVTPGDRPDCFNSDGTKATKEVFVLLASGCGTTGGGGGDTGAGNPPSGGDPSSGGGNTDYSGIFIPNPYEGDADLNNPDFVFATQVWYFISTITDNNYSVKQIVEENAWIYPNIVQFMKVNGGLTQANKDATTFALNNIISIFNLYPTYWTVTDIDLLHYNAFHFLLQNPNDQAQSFIQYLADNSNSLGEIDFAYRVIVDKSLKDNPCLNGVYTKLGKAPIFQSYLKKFDRNFSVANLNLSVGVDPNYPNASAVTYEPINSVIEIKFNPNFLNSPPLNIARTFFHEILHAEMYRKLLSLSPGGNITWSASFIESIKDDYPGITDYYTRYLYNVPAGQSPSNAQHELMAQHSRDIIIKVLKQYDNTQTEEVYNALAWIGLMGTGNINNTTGLPPQPTVAWGNVAPAMRLQILATFYNFYNTNPPCQQ